MKKRHRTHQVAFGQLVIRLATDKDIIVGRFQRGETQKQMAQSFGVALHTMRQALVASGIEPPQTRRQPTTHGKAVLAVLERVCLASGVNYDEIKPFLTT